MLYFNLYKSPIGALQLFSNGDALTAIYMENQRYQRLDIANAQNNPSIFTAVEAQLSAYFAGDLQRFDLPVAPVGTAFQLSVWEQLTHIPYAVTENYGALASRLGKPSASRAVGMANGRNPLSIVIPCHRVIGKNGSLTGYGGGLDRKQWLLEHEAKHATGGRDQA